MQCLSIPYRLQNETVMSRIELINSITGKVTRLHQSYSDKDFLVKLITYGDEMQVVLERKGTNDVRVLEVEKHQVRLMIITYS